MPTFDQYSSNIFFFMKKIVLAFCLLFSLAMVSAQEIMANVTVNAQQLAGSNQQVYRNLERSLREYINKTSWEGKKLQNFEKVKANFAFVITGREGNKFLASLVVQAVRPVYGSTYESPLININDTKVAFEYVENENLIFNERQFSGKNLTDLVSFYIYLILGYDGDSFQNMGGQEAFVKAQAIARNAVNRGYEGWSQIEGPRTRGALIDGVMNSANRTLRETGYRYHRLGLDNLSGQNQAQAKQVIAESLFSLRVYENNFQQNYAINLFLDTKASEIYDVFNSNNNGTVNMADLKNLMTVFSPKNTESKWNNWK